MTRLRLRGARAREARSRFRFLPRRIKHNRPKKTDPRANQTRSPRLRKSAPRKSRAISGILFSLPLFLSAIAISHTLLTFIRSFVRRERTRRSVSLPRRFLRGAESPRVAEKEARGWGRKKEKRKKKRKRRRTDVGRGVLARRAQNRSFERYNRTRIRSDSILSFSASNGVTAIRYLLDRCPVKTRFKSLAREWPLYIHTTSSPASSSSHRVQG